LTSYVDALDWASGDMLKVEVGVGAKIIAIPAGRMPGKTDGIAISAGMVGEVKTTYDATTYNNSTGGTEVTMTNCTITLTSGVWLFMLNGFIAALFSSSGNGRCMANLLIYESSTDVTTTLFNSPRVQSIDVEYVNEGLSTFEISLSCQTVINLSESKTYQLKLQYQDTSTAIGASTRYNTLKAIRIA
jgi:hypothetical protein